MLVSVNLYSRNKSELNKFLSSFYNTTFEENFSNWEKKYTNPIEVAEIIGAFIDNIEDYPSLSMWVCLDKNVFIHINKENADNIIRYLYERFPY